MACCSQYDSVSVTLMVHIQAGTIVLKLANQICALQVVERYKQHLHLGLAIGSIL